MACGIPTLVAAGTCLEEVAGPGAVIADVEDIPGMSLTLERMLTSEEWRQELSLSGLHRAALYRWPACVDHTITAYQSILYP